MKFLTCTAISALFILPAAAGAQTAPAAQPTTTAPTGNEAPTTQAGAQATTPTVGATVYDSTGAVLGTVDQVTPQAVVINVDGTKVGLPPASVGAGPQGLRVATTKADITAQAQQAQAGQAAQLQQQLTAGTTVLGAAGASVGTVKSADPQYVTLTTEKGDVKLPIAAFSIGASGPQISMTAEQLDAAIVQAGGGQTSARTTGDATNATGDDGTAAESAAGAASATKATTRTKTTTKRTQRSTSR